MKGALKYVFSDAITVFERGHLMSKDYSRTAGLLSHFWLGWSSAGLDEHWSSRPGLFAIKTHSLFIGYNSTFSAIAFFRATSLMPRPNASHFRNDICEEKRPCVDPVSNFQLSRYRKSRI